QGEADVLAKISAELPQPAALDDETRENLQPFLAWTTEKNCRYAPAKGFVVAAFVLDQAATGASTETILRRVSAISILHDRYGLSDPVSSSAARYALGYAIPTEAPRSWNKLEKEAFVQLPPEVKAAIHRREHQRETEVRRMQNQLAELKRQQQSAADNKEPISKETKTMAKKEGHEKGVGPYAGGDKDSKVKRDSSGVEYS